MSGGIEAKAFFPTKFALILYMVKHGYIEGNRIYLFRSLIFLTVNYRISRKIVINVLNNNAR